MSSGVCVYLVGAGPGDPGLLTCKARDLVRRADCIIYDYLASPRILEAARHDADIVYVGKKGFQEHVTQDQINELVLRKACELAQSCDDREAVLVRLKGGDPFVFGRGGEEALACAQAGIRFEVVPGVTSGVAAPACAGIPVTHRGVSTNVTFVTGNEDPTKDESTVAWQHLAGLVGSGGTVCFYMGMRNLGLICRKLAEHGVRASAPVAVVEWGSTARQRAVAGTLETIVELVEKAGLGAPAMIVVGEVVSLGAQLDWRASLPLAGKRIVVTRATQQAGELSSRLEALGAWPIEVPTIQITDPDETGTLDGTLARLGDFSWVVFTSANGVHRFFEALSRSGCEPTDARALGKARIAAMGPGTERALQQHGLRADVLPRAFVAEEMFAALQEAGLAQGQQVLIPRAQQARDVLPRLLEEAGAHVIVAPAYKSVMPEQAPEQLARALEEVIDGIVFTSSSTAANLDAALSQAVAQQPALGEAAQVRCKVPAFSIGPITSATLRELGWSSIMEADPYTIPGVVDALAAYFAGEAEEESEEETREEAR